jgi:hypothetical protein
METAYGLVGRLLEVKLIHLLYDIFEVIVIRGDLRKKKRAHRWIPKFSPPPSFLYLSYHLDSFVIGFRLLVNKQEGLVVSLVGYALPFHRVFAADRDAAW